MKKDTPESRILRSFKSALALVCPGRVVTRALKDFSDRPMQDLRKGIFTVMAIGKTGEDVYQRYLKFMVVGQIALQEKNSGEDIEDAELVMASDIENLLQRRLTGPLMRIVSVDHSAQLDTPYGWVSISIEAGPYDATEPLTVDSGIGHLADFLTFTAAVDLEPSVAAGEQHERWLKEPPDYQQSQPDALMHVDLPRSS